MFSRVEVISPEIAELYLKKSAGNRALSMQTVNNYARDMACGKWELTSQGITFSVSGVLTDGHHRLNAVIKSGVTVQMNVTYDEPDGVFIHDRGRPRTQGNVLYMKGFERPISSTVVVGAINWMFTMCGFQHVSDQTLYEFVTQNHDALVNLRAVCKKGASSAICEKSPILAAAFCAMHCGDPQEKLLDFFICANTGFSDTPDKSAAIVLRNFILSNNFSTGVPLKKRLFAVTTNAIKDFIDGNPRRRIYKPDAPPIYFERVKEELLNPYLSAYAKKREANNGT